MTWARMKLHSLINGHPALANIIDVMAREAIWVDGSAGVAGGIPGDMTTLPHGLSGSPQLILGCGQVCSDSRGRRSACEV